jgi:hypothetical protein
VTSICGTPGLLTGMSVTRVDLFPQNQITFTFPAYVTSTDGPAIGAVARSACQLPTFPSGPMHCPADFGISYLITFDSGSQFVRAITASPTGCPRVTGLGAPRWDTASFWSRLASALNLPVPREYCDPFRGQLPTAPSNADQYSSSPQCRTPSPSRR